MEPAAAVGWKGHSLGNSERNSEQIGRKEFPSLGSFALFSPLPAYEAPSVLLLTDFIGSHLERHLGNVVCAYQSSECREMDLELRDNGLIMSINDNHVLLAWHQKT